MKINYELLKRTCNASIESFGKYAHETVRTKDGLYHYIDRGSNVLAIAHLDTVLNKPNFKVKRHKGTDFVYSQQLDDRLGAYVLLYVLPTLGINVDVLLTEGEERGCSTGRWFTPSKEYNWMFQFDRRGEDVVMYEYETTELTDALVNAGFDPGMGTFSDICSMNHMGIQGFNVGTGYENEHHSNCRANTSALGRQVDRFVRFYHANVDRRFEWDMAMADAYWFNKYNMKGYNPGGASWYDPNACYLCNLPPRVKGDILDLGDGIKICGDCLPYAAQCSVCMDYFLDTEIIRGMCPDCKYYDDKMKKYTDTC